MYIAINAFYRRLVEETQRQVELAERAESMLHTPNFSKYLHLEDQVLATAKQLERVNGLLQAVELERRLDLPQQLYQNEQLLDQAIRQRRDLERKLDSVAEAYYVMDFYVLHD